MRKDTLVALTGVLLIGALIKLKSDPLVVNHTVINSSVDTMEKTKREEWETKGYRPGLTDKALLWAREWTEGLINSPLYSMLGSETKEKAAIDLYKVGLDRGERWIQAFGK